jgi:predicted transcriptional regulator
MTSKNILQLVCSDLRRNILISLNNGEKSLVDLREELKISSTTALHALRELEKGNLTFQAQNKKFSVTDIGTIITLKIIDFNNASEALKKHERFWLDHDLSGIPEHHMKKIGLLKDSNLVVISELDISKTNESYIAFIKTANWIKGVSPLYSPEYPRIFKELVEKNINTQIILTASVFKKLEDAIGLENIKSLIYEHPLEIFMTEENLKVAFTVTDSFLSLGLFGKNGVYDITHDLIGTDESAIIWGNELFEYYRDKAKKYEI